MAYTPTVWETGDVITAEKLNKAENGIAAATPIVFTLTIDDHDVVSFGKSWSDLVDLCGTPVYLADNMLDAADTPYYNMYMLALMYTDSGAYKVSFTSVNQANAIKVLVFSAETESAVLSFSAD